MIMQHAAKFVLGFLVALVVIVGSNLTSVAQAEASLNRPIYYIAPDANNVGQVYQRLLDGSSPRQLTQSATDVITFGVSYDGLAIAYISGNQLWLQPIHTEEAEALADVVTAQFFSSPIFSQDGQYIAYADKGVWLFDLGTRENRQLLQDVDLTGNNNMAEFRRYDPQQFVLGDDGKATQLIVRVGVWEWNTAGVYDLASGELTTLDGMIYNNLLPLSDGFVLVYGNGGIAGDPSISIAPSLDNINEAVKVLNFSDITDDVLFAEQAVEIAPQVVRIFGQTLSEGNQQFRTFYFDYNLVSGAGKVQVVPIAEPDQQSAMYGQLSPDGTLLPVYINMGYRDYGTIYGELQLLNVVTNETLPTEFPDIAGIFRWQP
jgi:hypothetical protein